MKTYTEEEHNEIVRVNAELLQISLHENDSLRAENARLTLLLDEASAAFDAGDLAKLTQMRATAKQTEKEKALAELLQKKSEIEAKIAELEN